MDVKQIERINELARKAKTGTLTDAEKAERQELRKAYIASFRGDLERTLQNAYMIDESGNKVPIKKKKG